MPRVAPVLERAVKRQSWNPETVGRLDATVRARVQMSHKKVRSAIRTGKVTVEGKRVLDPAVVVHPDQTLTFDMAAPNPARTEPDGLRLVYRDPHLLVVDKPAGLNTTPAPNRDERTALHGAMQLCRKGRRAKVVHRLDRHTSGLLLFARGVPMARELRAAFDGHHVQRRYRCVVQGVPAHRKGMISSMLVRDAGQGRRGSRFRTLKTRPLQTPNPGPMQGAGKLAITRYETKAHADGRTALEVWLATGRTHQIRIHMAEIGCPILGERVYGRIPGAPRQALHSAVLAFVHPVTGADLRFESPWPEDLSRIHPIGPEWHNRT